MRPASAAYLAAVATSGVALFRCEVLTGGVVVAEFDMAGGSLTFDRDNQIRGSGDLTLPDPAAIPLLASDPIAPYGNELRISRGVRLTTGDEYVPLIVMRIETVEATAAGVRVSGKDRAAAIADARFLIPYTVEAGQNACDAIRALVDDGVPGLTWVISPTGHVTTDVVYPEMSDRLDAAIEMAAAIGYELFFDGYGQAVLQPEPSPSEEPVADLVEGEAGVLVSVSKRWSRDGGYNAVIASGENSSLVLPVRGEAYDLDPASPTYWLGPYGKVPRWYSNPNLATDDQAEGAALAVLQRELGVSEAVNLGAVPNPTLEPGDVVLVTRAQLGIDRTHVIDRVTIPLDVTTPMSASTRSRQAA